MNIAFGCSPEYDDKTLLLKIPHIQVIGHGKIILVLTDKLPPCWLALLVLEDALQAACG